MTVSWPKVITYPLKEEDMKVLNLIHSKRPMTVSNGVEAIKEALQDYYFRHGPQPEGGGGKNADIQRIKAQVEGVSTAQLKSLLLDILAEIKRLEEVGGK